MIIMMRSWIETIRTGIAAAVLVILCNLASAGEPAVDVKTQLEQQRRILDEQRQQLEQQARQIEMLRHYLEGGKHSLENADNVVPVADVDAPYEGGAGKPETAPLPKQVDEAAVKQMIGDYVREHPGCGMPQGVQVGYSVVPLTPQIGGGGFVIRSAPNPSYENWTDECRIPFELRIRGRFQFDYYHYQVTEHQNKLTGRPATQNLNTGILGSFDALEVKRGNIVFEGTAFNPDFRYRVNFNGFTRGIQGLQNNEVLQAAPAGGTAPNTFPVSPIGAGVSVDHGVTLFECFVSYDIHGCASEMGCGQACPEGTVLYRPTYSLLVGKFKPFFGLDEFLGNQNMQFVEFSMGDLFFDADDDARLMGAGFQIKHCEDRLLWQMIVTNGGEGAFLPATHLDSLPGVISGLWYDIGGDWNSQRKAWNLYGDSICDIDYSCVPVARIGGCVNLVPMAQRSLYGDGEQSRIFVVPGAPGGTRLINLLNGGLGLPPGSHAVDKFDAYTFTSFAAAKYRGFSIENEWWFRQLNNFRTTGNGLGNIVYQDALGPNGALRNALFPANRGLFDFGTELAVGYFIVPKKLEFVARYSMVCGQSGDINGDGRSTPVNIPGFVAPVQVVNGAFTHYRQANEYTMGINYYIKRHLVKWQTDVGYYDGGNPDSPAAQSIGGFVSGADGWLFRTQLQMAF